MLTDQQIDEFLEMLAKSPTSARDMVRGLFAAHEAKAEPFGYFRAEPFGWTDCAATDEGAIALYERPAAPAVPQGEPVAFAWRAKKGQPSAWQVCFDLKQAADAEVLAKTEILFMSWTTPAATSQPLTDEVFRPIVKAVFDAGWATCRASELVGDNAKEFAWDMYGDELTERLIAAIPPQEPVTLTLTDEEIDKVALEATGYDGFGTQPMNSHDLRNVVHGAIAALREKEGK